MIIAGEGCVLLTWFEGMTQAHVSYSRIAVSQLQSGIKPLIRIITVFSIDSLSTLLCIWYQS